MRLATRIPDSASGPLPQTQAALDYATTVHRGQRRDDGAPFVEHLLDVAALLYGVAAPDHLIAAGALHDVLEKTPATAFDLRRRFGSTIASLVLAVTEDERIDGYNERKRALRRKVAAAGDEALILFAADKVSKARELHAQPVPSWGRARRSRLRRLAHYERCLALLQERLPDSPLVLQLRIELARLPRRPSLSLIFGRRAEQAQL
ncbi:MAG TPA: HD domain-containing protein [Solirubrobacteraceae bacterium]|jgi:(p)ppGpp synthase/HD superfamily hydrolase|nr:HD domain-containing protein [Solirubrobacteraceae bacterium]